MKIAEFKLKNLADYTSDIYPLQQISEQSVGYNTSNLCTIIDSKIFNFKNSCLWFVYKIYTSQLHLTASDKISFKNQWKKVILTKEGWHILVIVFKIYYLWSNMTVILLCAYLNSLSYFYIFRCTGLNNKEFWRERSEISFMSLKRSLTWTLKGKNWT